MRRQVVEDDDVARAQRWDEDWRDVRKERGVVDRAVEDRGARSPSTRNPATTVCVCGVRLPMAARREIPETHAAGTAAIAAQQIGRHARFIDEDVGAGVVQRLRRVPLAAGGP